MDLKKIKKVFENSNFFSKIFIEDDFEISGLINLWNRNDIDISIEFNPDYADDIDFYKTSLNLIEEKLNWINENKKLICKTFIEDEGVFYGLNDEIEKELSKKRKAKIGNLEFLAPLTEEEFTNSLYNTYINFYIEDENNINCNFDLDCEPDYLFGHLANIEIDENNDILMSGING